jgi:septal ring-binding cell division protein DamX
MRYQFALDKLSLISLIAGSVLIGALLFFSGWIVGRQWPIAESQAAATDDGKDERAALPTEPVLKEEAPAPGAQKPKGAKPEVTVPQEETGPAPQTDAAAAASRLPGTGAASMPPVATDVRVIESTTDSAASNGEKADTAETQYVTVQVGVFLDQKEASRLLHQMEQKGYAPTFFAGRDAEARQWYAVRIGVYADRQQAANAAANFTKQEQIKAVVRPAGSL